MKISPPDRLIPAEPGVAPEEGLDFGGGHFVDAFLLPDTAHLAPEIALVRDNQLRAVRQPGVGEVRAHDIGKQA
jgi:hypothetical protein